MISLKTGALLEKSILIGANYAMVDEKYKSLLSTYGVNLGIIFQIIDDLLGTFGDEKITGKPTDGDIREGKKSCLLITALNKLSEEDKKQLIQLIENPNISENDVNEVKILFQKADAANICRDLAKFYYNEAKKSLEQLKEVINDSEFEFFDNLLNFVIERKF
jgi:geranylgeranyl pyrophosphate synthase